MVKSGRSLVVVASLLLVTLWLATLLSMPWRNQVAPSAWLSMEEDHVIARELYSDPNSVLMQDAIPVGKPTHFDQLWARILQLDIY